MFLDKQFTNNQSVDIAQQSQPFFIIQLPYIGHPSFNFKKRLISIYKKFDIDVKVVFKSFKVGNYFSLKSKTPLGLRARIIYQYNCTCDRTKSYIGKTKRHLATRSKEHFTRPSAILEHVNHCKICKQSSSIHNFSVLDTGKNDFELYIKEALYIKNRNPKLNIQLAQQGASFCLNIF